MFKSFLLLAALAGTMVSCKSNPFANGNYVVYKVNESNDAFTNLDPLNDTINAKLKSHFLNKRFQITFQDKFVTFHQAGSSADLLLAKQEYNGHITYTQSVDKGIATMDYILDKDKDETLLLNVRLHLPKRGPTFKPVQLPSNDTSQNHGNAVCHLSKID